MMKKTLIAGMAILLAAGSAQALGLSVEGGDDYSNLELNLGAATGGLESSLNWVHNDDQGDIGGLGLGFNLPMGNLMATVGAKAIYVSPRHGDDGAALAIGGGLTWNFSEHFALYGDGYYAPEGRATSHINEYQEANAGLRWNVVKPLNVSMGYRYVNVGGDEGRPDMKLADGPYLGIGLGF